MNIGVCDDSYVWLKRAERILETYADNRDEEWNIMLFRNAEELYNYDSESEMPIDILFLDIELGKGENGIRIAEHLNASWRSCDIIYLTDYLNYAVDVYETQHIYFILKNQFQEKLPLVLKKTDEKHQAEKNVYTFKTKNGIVRLHENEIFYFERDLRHTRIVSTLGTFVIKDSLPIIMKVLSGKHFIRCHNSYLVNQLMVLEWTKGKIFMKNGTEISVSRKYSKQVQEIILALATAQML